MRIGFDNDMYIQMQAERIRRRIEQFGGKLYLEFGGKLFDDYHASRVLPGFAPDSKARMLRSDIGIGYDEDALRLMDMFRGMGLLANKVVITRFTGQPHAEAYQRRLEAMGVQCYRHFPIDGYPSNTKLIVSEDGFGRNEFAPTTKPLVVVTAPGPGSGKLATCLSQLYHEHQRGVEAGYAKFETFPVWNLPHLEAYGEVTVNYNRDVETFPVVRDLLEKIQGESPYQSPTDMGVNMVGKCISADPICQEAAKNEIVRRYFWTAVQLKRTGEGEEALSKIELLMGKAGVSEDYSPARAAAIEKEAATGKPAAAMVLSDGSVVTGKTSDLLGAASSLLLNALKRVAGIPKEHYIVSDEALEPICRLKTDHLHSSNPRLHSDETLIALSISSATNDEAAQAIAAAEELKGCDAYFSVIISPTDEKLYRSLGINVCCEPKYELHTYYHR